MSAVPATGTIPQHAFRADDNEFACTDCGFQEEHLSHGQSSWAPSHIDAPRDHVAAEIGQQRLGAISRAASLAIIDQRPPRYVVDGILASDEYGVLAGPKGIGKSLLLDDMAVNVALGTPWLGRFPTEQGTALILSSEDSRARQWRRADAIARSAGHAPDELEGALFIHPVSFNVVADLKRLEAELDAIRPALVVLDPAYRYMAGVRGQLFDMGAVLTPLQEACTGRGAALVVGHHFNRREGAQREERISGAGLLEWARVVVTVDGPPRRDEDPNVTLTIDITGNSIDPLSFQVGRFLEAIEQGPNPELCYAAEVIAEGSGAREARTLTARERVQAALSHRIESAMTVKELGLLIAKDATGRGGLKADTIRKVLNRDLKDVVHRIGEGSDVRWWWPE